MFDPVPYWGESYCEGASKRDEAFGSVAAEPESNLDSNRASKCPLSNLGDPKLDDAPNPLGDEPVEKRGDEVRIESIGCGRPEGDSIRCNESRRDESMRPRPDDESMRPRPEGESRLDESVLIGCWWFNIPDAWDK